MSTNGRSLATAGLVLGIISILFSTVLFWVPFSHLLGVVVSIVGIICSANASKQLRQDGEPLGVATGGIILNIVSLVIAGFLVITCTICKGCIVCGVSGLKSIFS